MVISPELADVLSTIITRIRRPDGPVPLVVAYDYHERVWNPPMPLLFQWPFGLENRQLGPTNLRRILNMALAKTGLTDPSGAPLRFTPHDFRRVLSALWPCRDSFRERTYGRIPPTQLPPRCCFSSHSGP